MMVMQSNQLVKKRTIEEELKDPTSFLSIDINNALTNRAELRRALRIQEEEYASDLAAKEKAEEVEDERDQQRRREREEAVLRQSLEQYYKEQRRISEQALTLGLKPLSNYDFLMTSIGDFQHQVNMIALRLAHMNKQTQQAQAHYAAAAAQWAPRRAAYVKAYSNAVYQVLDLNGKYGQGLSLEHLKAIEAIREEGMQRGDNLQSPLTVLGVLPSEHIARQIPNAGLVALNRYEYLGEVLETVYLQQELRFYFENHPQGDAERDRVQNEYGSVNKFVKALRMHGRSNPAVQEERLKMLEMHYEMTCAKDALEKLQKRQRELEETRQARVHSLFQLLAEAGQLAPANSPRAAYYSNGFAQETAATPDSRAGFTSARRGGVGGGR